MVYDLVVIGGGAAGLGAARAAARARATVLLVSDGAPGGDCTFYGCVPSKTLIEAARQGLPYPKTAQRVRDVVARVAATERPEALRREGIDVLLGRARLLSASQVVAGGHRVQAGAVILATGSRPTVPAIPGLATARFLTNETIFDLREPPASLAVLGGGAVGCELAQAFARLGSRVTLVEAADRLLPREEPQASWTVTRVLAREGVEVRTGVMVEKVAADGRLLLSRGEEIATDQLLVTVGRTPVTEDLDLAAAGVATDQQGYVTTDGYLRTTAKGVCAVGDVTGRLPFTHAAYEMGRVAVGNVLGRWRRPRRYRPHATPWVTFTEPEVGRVGLTEAQAARVPGARVAYLPLSETDRAVAADRTDGFVKLIAGPRRLLGRLGGGRILGATIVAERGGEMIHEPALAMATRMFAGRLAAATHAYPTWSYAVQLAAAQFVMEIGGRTARPAQPD
ncbi:MAG: FAD-binding protein [Micromonosporaceae bacterium]|nr:FAD-binding protein [Micromonosporaceae bacterium]